jgi:hypothetical protein
VRLVTACTVTVRHHRLASGQTRRVIRGRGRRRRRGPARGARSPRQVAARRRSGGHDALRARPGPGTARRWPTGRSRPGTWRRPAQRRPRRPARRSAHAVGLADGGGRRSRRGRPGRSRHWSGASAAGGASRWAAAGMGDDEQAGTAVRRGHGLGYPHDRGEPCLLHLHPAHSPDHHQPDKPALCRGPASGTRLG